ncbi:MAG: DUF4430 domain-containing protein [Planctomycetota bacterium]|nr:DUF4430 domain-containing protein [Planctomycetota bacterium]
MPETLPAAAPARGFSLSRRAVIVAAALLAFPLLSAVLAQTGSGDSPSRGPAVGGDAKQVELLVEYSDSVSKRWKQIPWTPGMTVKGVLDHAAGLSGPSRLAYEAKGTGERSLLTSIDGLANEGGGASSRNWLFKVAGKAGQASFAVSEVAAGDTIEWRFAPYGWAEPGKD